MALGENTAHVFINCRANVLGTREDYTSSSEFFSDAPFQPMFHVVSTIFWG